MAASSINLVYTANHQLAEVPETNFSPRIGFAWNLQRNTVLRGAYGMFYAGIYSRGDGYNPGDDYPFSFAINITPGLASGSIASDSSHANGDGAPAAGPMDQGLAGVPLSPTGAQGLSDLSARQPVPRAHAVCAGGEPEPSSNCCHPRRA